MRRSLRFLALLALALPAACSDPTGAPASSAAVPRSVVSPAATACADALAAPAAAASSIVGLGATSGGSGATLIRYNMDLPVMMLQDNDNGLWVWYSSGDPSVWPCGGTPTLSMSVLDVMRRGDDPATAMIHTLTKAPAIFIKLWRLPFNACTTPPLAAGTGHLVFTQNDRNVYASSRENVDVHGLTAEGTLFDAGGQPYHFTGVWRARFDANPHDPADCFREIISNKLQPIGR
jgi:hypothetical protein